MSMKNSSDTNGNRTRDLPTCSAVPQLATIITHRRFDSDVSSEAQACSWH